MRLPISIFPNVTEYTRANWTGYLKPANVKLDSYSIPDIPKPYTTISQRPDGTIVMRKKGGTAWASDETNVSGTKLTISNIPANSKLVIVHELIKDAPDWIELWEKGAGYPEFGSSGQRLNSGTDAKKDLTNITCVNKTFSGTVTLSLMYGWEGAHTIYLAFYDADILDACLTGNHLKSISVGDKLGLVYWDGDSSIGGNYIDCCNVAGDKAYTLNVDAGYFNYYDKGNYIKLLDKAGTVNISNLLGAKDMTVYAIRGDEFQKHLFHVI